MARILLVDDEKMARLLYGAYLRAAGMPVYGFGGLWTIVGQSTGAHGLDERVPVEGFHGQVPIWEELLRRLAG